MTIHDLLRSHLSSHRSRDPFTVADLAIIATQKLGRRVTEDEAASAIMGGMLDGWAEEEGDGWVYRGPVAAKERMLFS